MDRRASGVVKASVKEIALSAAPYAQVAFHVPGEYDYLFTLKHAGHDVTAGESSTRSETPRGVSSETRWGETPPGASMSNVARLADAVQRAYVQRVSRISLGSPRRFSGSGDHHHHQARRPNAVGQNVHPSTTKAPAPAQYGAFLPVRSFTQSGNLFAVIQTRLEPPAREKTTLRRHLDEVRLSASRTTLGEGSKSSRDSLGEPSPTLRAVESSPTLRESQGVSESRPALRHAETRCMLPRPGPTCGRA